MTDDTPHGEMPKSGPWCHSRRCVPCGGYHGHLYICEHYSEALRAQLEDKSQQFRDNLTDPKWIAEARAQGMTDEALAIWRMFAGIGVE